MSFIHEDFLLQTRTAQRLYHGYAENEPILDYHCHLPPRDIAENRHFANLFEIWLEGDHYKWRAMRANGVSEKYVTGDADPFDKFLAWARTVPATLRNPLYHWTHLELKRYFGIDRLLDEGSAAAIWRIAEEQLTGGELTAQTIPPRFRVKALCTTDDPTDDLHWHRRIFDVQLTTRVYPAYRPDKALNVHILEQFNEWTNRLAALTGRELKNFESFLEALEERHAYFHQMGCRLSDHGLNTCFSPIGSEGEAARVFAAAREGQAASPEDHAKFAGFLMVHFGRLDARRGWVKQLHLGARRNNNSRMARAAGPDTGYDSIGDWPQIDAVGAYLDALDRENALPKMVLYNLNPADNYAFATMAGNFQDGKTPGKIQFGSGWWFLDQKEAMEWQLNALSNCGLLSRFIGMLTDSRSFMSYPRHEYFRRVLCDLLGDDIEKGLLPNDEQLIGGMIRNVCYKNVRDFMALEGIPG